MFSAMPFKLPLSHNDLRAVRERQPWNTDVIALLWEGTRLGQPPQQASDKAPEAEAVEEGVLKGDEQK